MANLHVRKENKNYLVVERTEIELPELWRRDRHEVVLKTIYKTPDIQRLEQWCLRHNAHKAFLVWYCPDEAYEGTLPM